MIASQSKNNEQGGALRQCMAPLRYIFRRKNQQSLEHLYAKTAEVKTTNEITASDNIDLLNELERSVSSNSLHCSSDVGSVPISPGAAAVDVTVVTDEENLNEDSESVQDGYENLSNESSDDSEEHVYETCECEEVSDHIYDDVDQDGESGNDDYEDIESSDSYDYHERALDDSRETKEKEGPQDEPMELDESDDQHYEILEKPLRGDSDRNSAARMDCLYAISPVLRCLGLPFRILFYKIYYNSCRMAFTTFKGISRKGMSEISDGMLSFETYASQTSTNAVKPLKTGSTSDLKVQHRGTNTMASEDRKYIKLTSMRRMGPETNDRSGEQWDDITELNDKISRLSTDVSNQSRMIRLIRRQMSHKSHIKMV